MRNSEPARLLMLLAVGALLGGCAARRGPYLGPTESMDRVVAQVNANNEKLPTLRGEGHYEAWIKQGNQTTYVSDYVSLNYAHGRSLLLRAKYVTSRVFEIGSNEEEYWLIVDPPYHPEESAIYVGSYKNIERADLNRLPVRPDAVVEVLALQVIPTNFLQQPSPTMKFNPDRDAYMITWNTMLSDRWIATKEIWYDRATLMPIAVWLYDPNGRVVLRAYLLDHQGVEVPGLPKAQWPKVATAYQLFMPDNGLTMNFDLKSNLALSRNGAPNARTFVFPGENAGVSHVIQLDEPAAH